MTVQQFRSVLAVAKGCSEADRKWFPLWVKRFAAFRRAGDDQLDVACSSAVEFSKMLKELRAPAWQRLQAVRALAAYRHLLLRQPVGDFDPIIQALKQAAGRERQTGWEQPPTQREIDSLRGVIDTSEAEVIQKLRTIIRLLHYKYSTERAYVAWVQRFIQFVNSDKLMQFGESEISKFLSGLAVEGDVAASTQNQAKSALLFLYELVLGKELGMLTATNAKRPEKLPVVLSTAEAAACRTTDWYPAADVPADVRGWAASQRMSSATRQGHLF